MNKKQRFDQLNPDMFTGKEQQMFDDLRRELCEVSERHMLKAKTESETVAIAAATIEFSKCILSSEMVGQVQEFSRKASLRNKLRKNFKR